MAVLNFVVIRDYSGKPIRNASVVMHPVEKNGKQSKGGLQIKTDPDGKPVLTACLTASCESRCWPPVSRLLATTTPSTNHQWRSRSG